MLACHGPIVLSASLDSADKIENPDLVGLVGGGVLPELMSVESDGFTPSRPLQIGLGEVIGGTCFASIGVGYFRRGNSAVPSWLGVGLL